MSIGSINPGPDHWGLRSRRAGRDVAEQERAHDDQVVDTAPIAAAMAETATEMRAADYVYSEPPEPPAVPCIVVGRPPLDEIATLIGALTYGEMIELAQAMWNAKGDKEITAETLPSVLHLWSLDPHGALACSSA